MEQEAVTFGKHAFDKRVSLSIHRPVAVLFWFLLCSCLSCLNNAHAQLASNATDYSPEWQKLAGGKMAFEVASIHLADPNNFHPPNFPLSIDDSYTSVPGRFTAEFPITVYIQFAYKLALSREQQEALLAHLPQWVANDSFRIDAKAEGKPTKDQMRLMMQALLTDRFKLKTHFEKRETLVYALILESPGKIGPKLKPHKEGPACDTPSLQLGETFPLECDVYAMKRATAGGPLLGSRNTTLDLLSSMLMTVSPLARPVNNQTGLSGRYDFTLEWAPDTFASAPSTSSTSQDVTEGPSFLSAIKEQLGLKLKATTAPVDTLIIDHIERPSEN